MKSLSLHKSIRFSAHNYDRTLRVARNVRVIYNIARFGRGALTKLNPAMVYVDAFISLIDVYNSYISYKKAVERTKQLEHELETCKIELSNLRKQYEEILKTEKLRLEKFNEAVDKKIEIQREKQKIIKLIYEQTGKHLEDLKKFILEAKRNYMSDDSMVSLEKKYHKAIHARIEITLHLLGG